MRRKLLEGVMTVVGEPLVNLSRKTAAAAIVVSLLAMSAAIVMAQQQRSL